MLSPWPDPDQSNVSFSIDFYIKETIMSKIFIDPVTQGDTDVIAAQLRDSKDYAERYRLAEVARKLGHLLPAHFAPKMAVARREAGEVVTFSADGSQSADMSEGKASILATFNDGQALLAKFGLKGNPPPVGDGTQNEVALRAAADKNLAHSEQGRTILARRGFSATQIERLQRPN
jgi:hypothetical protein